MDKKNVIEFFDRLAHEWDADMVRDSAVIGEILDAAQIAEGIRVLDVACGTGVLIPDYLARNVRAVVGVDISPEMIRIAQAKFVDPRVSFINADIEALCLPETFDRCMVYNAFPHFPDPRRLIRGLASHLAPGGRLTVAHGMSRAAINRHHSGGAAGVSRELESEKEIAALFEPFFAVDTAVSDEKKYLISGVKR